MVLQDHVKISSNTIGTVYCEKMWNVELNSVIYLSKVWILRKEFRDFYLSCINCENTGNITQF